MLVNGRVDQSSWANTDLDERPVLTMGGALAVQFV